MARCLQLRVEFEAIRRAVESPSYLTLSLGMLVDYAWGQHDHEGASRFAAGSCL